MTQHDSASATGKLKSKMPSLLIKTNVQLDEEKKGQLMKECSKSVSKLLRKPERFVLVSYETSSMIFAGKSDPCAYAVCIA